SARRSTMARAKCWRPHRRVIDPGSLGRRNFRAEKVTARGQIFVGSPAHSGSMGQESAEIWTAQALLQAGRFLRPRLLGRVNLHHPPSVKHGVSTLSGHVTGFAMKRTILTGLMIALSLALMPLVAGTAAP